MDARRRDIQGRTICPGCKKAYRPVLGDYRDPNIRIQDQFPNATIEQREELSSGYCTKCQKGKYSIFRDPSKNCRVIKHFIKTDDTSKGFSYDQAVNWR